MRIDHILLDMDGVLADFATAAVTWHKRPEILDDWPPGEWSIAKVLGVSESDFWRLIDNREFWTGLRPYSWARPLVRNLLEIAPVTIATSPSRNPDCVAGKRVWLYEQLGDLISPDDVMLGSKKWLMAKPGHVLIDDSDANIAEFVGRGGVGVLFPRPWNRKNGVGESPLWHTVNAVRSWSNLQPMAAVG